MSEKLDLDRIEAEANGRGAWQQTIRRLVARIRELEEDNLELSGIAQAADAQCRELERAQHAGEAREPTECEPIHANEDGWCDWQFPIHRGYKMACCDCGLVHDVEFDVVKIVERHADGSWRSEDVEDADYRVAMRMKREIAAPRPAALPEGFVLVPKEPTPRMVDATFNDAIETSGEPESHNTRNRRIYAAMLAAAPQPREWDASATTTAGEREE